MVPEVRRQVARLFAALEYGEQLAHLCAIKQASFVNDRRAQRFLQVQARQERVHALFYHQAAQYLMPKHCYSVPYALAKFGARLEQAMDRDDFDDILVGSQVVLEGFGEQVLSRLNRNMDERGVGFHRMRHVFLRQEQSHHEFGLKTLSFRRDQEKVSQRRLNVLTEEYLDQINTIVDEMADVFLSLSSDPNDYLNGMLQALPGWLRGGTQ